MQEEHGATGDRPFTDRGTPEPVWRAWEAPARWPSLDVSRPPREIVVVAPHPDDEVLGVGGLMSLLDRAGVAVSVVAVTDGDASHPRSPTLRPSELARRRVDEQRAALAAIGLPHVPVHRLGIPDGQVTRHEQALADRIAPLLAPDGWILATYAGDRHPDHEAVGRAAARAAARTGARLLEYPVWTWHWAVPDDPRIPWERARRVVLSPELQAAKRRAVDCYRTQIAPLSDDPADAEVLPADVLARLLRPAETVFV